MPSFTIQIEAPPERVFEELAHVERHPSWANPKARLTMAQTGGEGPGLGATYRSNAVFGGKDVSADLTVTGFDPSTRFTIRSTQHQQGKKDVWYQNDYVLRPSGAGTTVTKHLTGGLSPVIFLVASRAIRKDAMTSLANLKRRMESAEPANGS
jgi:uncharacterized protein YndB with AHSA1/START domain